MPQAVQGGAIGPCKVAGTRLLATRATLLGWILAAALLAGCATETTGTSISVGRGPCAIAITPDGSTAYVVNCFDDTVTPINLSTKTPGIAIKVGFDAAAIAISPNGTTAYVLHGDNSAACTEVSAACNSMTLINLATKTRGIEIKVGSSPAAIAIAPSGTTAYVVDSNPQGPLSSITVPPDAVGVTPINLATNTPGTAIHGPFGQGFQDPIAIALTPNSSIAYVANSVNGTVTPIDLASKTARSAIAVGREPIAIAITPDGTTAYVVNKADDTVTPINLATDTPGPPIPVGGEPEAIAISPDGITAYVVNHSDNSVTPIKLASNTPGMVLLVGRGPDAIAITPDGANAYVVNLFDNNVTPVKLIK